MATHIFIFDKSKQVIGNTKVRICAKEGVYIVDDKTPKGKAELAFLRGHGQNKDVPPLAAGKFKEVTSGDGGGCRMDDLISMSDAQIRIMLEGIEGIKTMTRGELLTAAMKEND